MNMIEENWLLILLAVAVAALIAWYVFHAARRTRVTGERRDVLDEGSAPAARNQALIDAAAAAAAPLATSPGLTGESEAIDTSIAAQPVASAAASAPSSDLSRLKGVGPKLVAQLGALGVTQLSQVAAWTDSDIDRIDAQLGRFQGRIRRDQWVEQALLLTAGDEAGFAARFGATR
jgi:predicted flap endonuclease-1-like 5' DNA nuclease